MLRNTQHQENGLVLTVHIKTISWSLKSQIKALEYQRTKEMISSDHLSDPGTTQMKDLVDQD